MPSARLRNPRYSKQDYELVAALLNNRHNLHAAHGKTHYYDEIAKDFADKFQTDNPAMFPRERFLKACGVQR